MTLTMVRPIMTPFRWLEHGDIGAYLDHPAGPLFAVLDVAEVLEIEIPTYHDAASDRTEYLWPADAIEVKGFRNLLDPVVFLTVENTRLLASNNPSYLTVDFLAWLETTLTDLHQVSIAKVVELSAPTPEAALGRTYSVALAARILTRDPAINIGQQSLFDAMQGFGWIKRDEGIWRPRHDLIMRGLLLQQQRRVPGRRDLYPQIRITVDGIQELHRRFNGIATLNLDAPAPLTLVEI